MPRSTMSSSSSSGSQSSRNSAPLPYSKSLLDFEVERSERLPKALTYANSSQALSRRNTSDANVSERVFQSSVSALMSGKARPFSISGHIPLDPNSLTVFFRSQGGTTRSLDFPIDVDTEAPPELDMLIAACKPHATCELDGFSDRESMYYPPNLPLTATLELANHPILDAVRTSLFPRLATGQHLIAVRDLLELVPTGGHMCPQRRAPEEEGKVATIVVTLPIRFKGGALVVHDFEQNEEKYYGRGGKPGDLEWTAFLADCDREIETVQRGVRLTLSYKVLLRTYGPSPSPSQSLMIPSDRFLDLISPVLNMSRGRTIAFYLQEQYGFSPAEVLAESLVPHLKGGDALLYHSLRLYKLLPALRWAAGGYVWPVDATVECGSFTKSRLAQRRSRNQLKQLTMTSMTSPNGRQQRALVPRGGFSLSHSSSSDDEEDESTPGAIRTRVEDSGAVLLTEAGIDVLADDTISNGTVTKEKVPYVSAGTLDKLVINVLLVVYVP